MKVFSKKKYIEVMGASCYNGLYRDDNGNNWVDEADGHEVKGISIIGTPFVANNNWCIEKEESKMQPKARKLTMKDFAEKKIAVWFDNLEQEKEFLKLCEKNNMHFRVHPIGYTPNDYGFGDKGTAIVCNFWNKASKDLTISFGTTTFYEDYGYKCVNASEFISARESTEAKYRVVIECADGKTTTAKLIVNGREVKTATARRDDRDKFSLATGINLACKRLFEKR